jgi:hypothetical protein
MGKTIIKDDRLVEDFWLLDLAAEGADTAGESAAKKSGSFARTMAAESRAAFGE